MLPLENPGLRQGPTGVAPAHSWAAISVISIVVLQLAELAGLSEPDKLALGNWIDKGVGTGQTPARYYSIVLPVSGDQLGKVALLGAARAFGHLMRWKEA